MASTLNVFLGATAATLFWTFVGLAIAKRLDIDRSLVWPIAPTLGWAAHSAAALPIFSLVGFSSTTVWVAGGLVLSASMTTIGAWTSTESPGPDSACVPTSCYVGAALLALAPALAILPKVGLGGVDLASPIFDHAKIALVDEMSRLGVPPGNPFIGGAGEPSKLAYYYLWHFSAAELSLGLRVTGWEADAALTWFTAFSSLTLMMGLATWFAGRSSASVVVLLFSAVGSLWRVLEFIFGPRNLYSVVLPPTGFGGWLFQASWAPQHLASACCVVLSAFLMSRIAGKYRLVQLATFILVAAAGYESSAWVGGVTFAAAAATAGLVLLVVIERKLRLAFVMQLAVAAIAAFSLVAPFLYGQYVATLMRGNGIPIAMEPFNVLEDLPSKTLTTLLDLPAFWLVLLVIELPAIYVTGSVALIRLIASRTLELQRNRAALAFASVLAASLMITWLVTSTIGENNDLGWRAVLPAVLGFTVFSAVGVLRWLAQPAPIAATAAIGAAVLGIPGAADLIHGYAVGRPAPSVTEFAATPALWEAVRRHSGPGDRVGNNPLFMQDMTPWPINISWALLANRRSCFAGNETALAFAPVPEARRRQINEQFVRVFDGKGSSDDIMELASRYRCRTIVVAEQDGAWANDPFAASPYFRLVEERAGSWRIYTATRGPPGDGS